VWQKHYSNNSMFRYSFEQHCELSQDIINLLKQVDAFPFSQLSYSLGASPYKSLGDIHNSLENVYVKSSAGERKHTVRMTIQEIRELFKEWEREKERMRTQNIPDLYWPRPWILKRTLEEHANEPDNTAVDIETTYDLGGYYSRNTNQQVQGYVVLRFDTREYPLVCTYIHEMMHAFYDADLRNPMNDAEYAEEPLAEYGMLHFVESFVRSHPEHSDMLMHAKYSVNAKQFDLGIAHYGFGAYLYEQFQHIDWERLMRAAHSKIINTRVPYTNLKAALQGAYPNTNNLPNVAQLLHDVLTQAIGVAGSSIVGHPTGNVFTSLGVVFMHALDYSFYTRECIIARRFHSALFSAIGSPLQRGTSCNIIVHYNGKDFEAILGNVNRSNCKNDTIRCAWIGGHAEALSTYLQQQFANDFLQISYDHNNKHTVNPQHIAYFYRRQANEFDMIVI